MADFVAAIDQGTTSTRCMIFDHAGQEVGRHQLEHEQIMPRAGWVEHDAGEIWQRTQDVVVSGALRAVRARRQLTSPRSASPTSARRPWSGTARPVGRTATPSSGRTPAPPSIAAELDRDGHGEVIRERAGLPPATYFAGGKLQVDAGERRRVWPRRPRAGDAIFGTTDSWLLWNLTGGVDGGRHVTDVTNASRTMLMNLETLDWDDELLELFGVPAAMLPEIVPSSRRRTASARPSPTARSAAR